MNRYCMIVASGALVTVSALAAQADCAAEIAKLDSTASAPAEGISKDGSLAPMQDGSATQGQQAAASPEKPASDGVAKDGTLAPLEGQGNADKTNQAMSADDAQAQQEGKPTAAAEATQGMAPDASLAEARAALAAGDEEACMKALEAAKAG
ncbi:hypothetical protein [Paracoccus sp. KR1-242]|uniref:hypothetical protein n=1 Tax=Paracoccus sp. KR1-242 TaxID=3410028 RepID=UPI003C0D42D4